MVLLIMIPIKWLLNYGNIPNIFRQTHFLMFFLYFSELPGFYMLLPEDMGRCWMDVGWYGLPYHIDVYHMLLGWGGTVYIYIVIYIIIYI